MALQQVTGRLVAAMLLWAGALQADAQTPTDDTAALEAQIKLKQLQLQLLQADQALKDADLKTMDQAQKQVAAQRLLARQADAEKLLDLQAAGAVSGAKVGNDLLLATKLKEAFGGAPNIGKEGAISITDGSTTQLLATRSGSAWASLDIANKICADLKDANVSGAYIAPAGFDEKLVRTRLFMAEVNSLKKYAEDQQATLDQVNLQSAAAVVASLQVARYLVGGVQDLAKTFRSDYALATVANNSRAALIEKSIGARCPNQLVNTDLETSLRLDLDSSDLDAALNTLIAFVDTYDGKLAAMTAQQAAAKDALAAEKAKTGQERSARKIADADAKVQGFLPLAQQLHLVEPAVKRFKTFFDSLKTRQADVTEALMWAGFDKKWKDKPRLVLTVSAQDVQITKTSAWTSQQIMATNHVEVLYHVLDQAGKVLVSGAREQSTSAPELEVTKAGTNTFSGCAITKADSVCP
ncbi:MAG: hypothetical protein LBJ15_15945 [Comamonas sp.]|jgi:hypothetical protein|uniref:hypothetical protein n=1 Tax=Comamonas sp. TaxID=34028 RepID=UPI00282892F7|nr:hypothetical protein [Comamonas sp.]MDR0215479.1 hypothetical protein [Comamonas sp.]